MPSLSKAVIAIFLIAKSFFKTKWRIGFSIEIDQKKALQMIFILSFLYLCNTTNCKTHEAVY